MIDVVNCYVSTIPTHAEDLDRSFIGKRVRITTPEGSIVEGPLAGIDISMDPSLMTHGGDPLLSTISVEVDITPFGLISIPAKSNVTTATPPAP